MERRNDDLNEQIKRVQRYIREHSPTKGRSPDKSPGGSGSKRQHIRQIQYTDHSGQLIWSQQQVLTIGKQLQQKDKSRYNTLIEEIQKESEASTKLQLKLNNLNWQQRELDKMLH